MRRAPLIFEVWGRSEAKAQAVVSVLQSKCTIAVADDLDAATRKADIIITATGSRAPLFNERWVRPSTNIKAVGADASGKQELETNLVARADLLVAYSVDQCLDHGEISHVFRDEVILQKM